MAESMGKQFRTRVNEGGPLQILGAVNAWCGLLAKNAGAKALYLSGAGVANASLGLPDLGMTTLSEVLEDARRINDVSGLPLLVDIDTGFGGLLNIERTIQSMERAGVAAVHIEDQIESKRCGHRPNKSIISLQQMGDRIKAAVDARINPDFVIMARTDAYAVEGMQAAIDRALYCVEMGADMIFPDALESLEQFQQMVQSLPVPVLANMTEFGKTPLFTREALTKAGIKLILYPLSAFRAMSKTACSVYTTILEEGSQKSVLDAMQTRDTLYEILNYQAFEDKLDKWLEKNNDQ